jgi:uncharacterized protein with HEPN domain
MSREVISLLAYILHALDALMEYTRDAFFADRKTQDAVVRNIEVLGQAVKGLSAEPGHMTTRSLGARSPGCATS